MRVEVYWNLHKSMWSIRSCKTGRVIDHAVTVPLTDVSWVVQQGGRQRVLQEGRKNVHAFARGTLAEEVVPVYAAANHPDARRVTYNPYKYAAFMADGQPIDKSAVAWLDKLDGRPAVFIEP